MPPHTDRLYRVDSNPEDFDFNARVVEVFDDMVDRSIPFYKEVIKATALLLSQHLEPGGQRLRSRLFNGDPAA